MYFLLYAAAQQRCSVSAFVGVAPACGLHVFGLAAKTAKAEQAIGPSAENSSVRDSDGLAARYVLGIAFTHPDRDVTELARGK